MRAGEPVRCERCGRFHIVATAAKDEVPDKCQCGAPATEGSMRPCGVDDIPHETPLAQIRMRTDT